MFGHEKLDVYKVSLQYVRWAFFTGKKLAGYYRSAREQLFRASQSIPLNIAEGNGKAGDRDRRHFFEIARGSALECAAIQDVLETCEGISAEQNRQGKEFLDRIVAMLTELGGRGYSVGEVVDSQYSESESRSESESAVL